MIALFLLALSLSGSPVDALRVVDDATTATADPWRQRWLIAWSWHESRWKPGAVDPTGQTFGSMQVDASTWGRAPADRPGQFEQAVEVLDMLIESCGSRRRALNSYATGRCERATDLAAMRCALIGGCDDRP